MEKKCGTKTHRISTTEAYIFFFIYIRIYTTRFYDRFVYLPTQILIQILQARQGQASSTLLCVYFNVELFQSAGNRWHTHTHTHKQTYPNPQIYPIFFIHTFKLLALETKKLSCVFFIVIVKWYSFQIEENTQKKKTKSIAVLVKFQVKFQQMKFKQKNHSRKNGCNRKHSFIKSFCFVFRIRFCFGFRKMQCIVTNNCSKTQEKFQE